MSRTAGSRVHLVRRIAGVLLVVCALYSGLVVVRATALGVRDADPVIYWPAVAVIGALGVAAGYGATRLLRRRR